MKLNFFTLFSSIFLVIELFGQVNMAPLGNRPYPNESLNDIWGYADQQGNEYALVGTTSGFSIVDVTNPVDSLPELFYEDGFNSTWRDIKTWEHYAYVTTDQTQQGTGFGLLIVNMENLPNGPFETKYYTGNNYPFESAHNLYIDENGICYIFGANYSEGGAIMLDLSQDPWNPVEVGVYDEFYFHDGVARGDTLWGSAVYDGVTVAVDVTTKSSPITMAAWDTPNQFSHNVWFSDDNKYVFTTDEVSNGKVAAYNVTNLSNVVELDIYQSSPGDNVIPHNTHYYNGFLVTSYYRDGVTIVDATHPYNLIEVGSYDTSPLSGNGFNGCWGAYPYLPSGNILATDIEEGLFVLFPVYTHACFLEGSIIDSICQEPLNGVTIEILGTEVEDQSNFDGSFNTGYHVLGTYTVRFSKIGYETLEVSGVTLLNGQTTNLNINMAPSDGSVNVEGIVSNLNSDGIENTHIIVENNQLSFGFTSDENGHFSRCGVPSGTYDVSAYQWGYKPYCLQTVTIDENNTSLSIQLTEGYEDNFERDLGWSTVSTASSGKWERNVPIETTDGQFGVVSPGEDSPDCGERAYITGDGGGNPWDDDIDNGTTILISPEFNVNGYGDAYLSFSHWYATYNAQGNNPFNDFIEVELTDGTDTVLVFHRDEEDPMSVWTETSLRIKDYIDTENTLKLIVTAVDLPEGNIVEAGFDNFKVFDHALFSEQPSNQKFLFYPNPGNDVINFEHSFSVSDELVFYLTDILGNHILSRVIQNSSGNIKVPNSISSGVYLISIKQQDKKVYTKRWVKQ